jgi:hypothetical protein
VSVLKSLKGRDYSVVPFKAYQSQSYSYTSGSSANDEQVEIDLAEQPPPNWTLELATGDDIPGFKNDSGRESYPLFSGLLRSFYSPSSSVTLNTNYYPSSSCFVVGVGSNAFGERIHPGTFKLSLGGNTITDNGAGKLFFGVSHVGNIFYEMGVGVIKRDEAGPSGISSDGMFFEGGDTATISFNSTLTIYEHTAVCKVEPFEFNWTWNPSTISGSSYISSLYREMTSGSLTPYVTSIGLYNEQNELMATAKLSRAMPRSKLSTQTFVVKFDT